MGAGAKYSLLCPPNASARQPRCAPGSSASALTRFTRWRSLLSSMEHLNWLRDFGGRLYHHVGGQIPRSTGRIENLNELVSSIAEFGAPAFLGYSP